MGNLWYEIVVAPTDFSRVAFREARSLSSLNLLARSLCSFTRNSNKMLWFSIVRQYFLFSLWENSDCQALSDTLSNRQPISRQCCRFDRLDTTACRPQVCQERQFSAQTKKLCLFRLFRHNLQRAVS